MDLREIVRTLRRNWILITAATLMGLLLGSAISMLTKPTYIAETQLFVAIQGSGSIQELQQGNNFGQARVQSYVKIISTPVVLQPAIDSLGLEVTADELSSRIEASSDVDTVLISISASDHSPVQAAAIAQAVGNSLVKAVDALEKPKSGGVSPVSLSIIKPATAPSAPSAPDTRINMMLGLVAGLALGLGGALLKDTLDNRIRSESDLRRVTNAPLLGGVSFDQDATTKPLLTQSAPQSPRAEAFRRLRTNLQFANVSSHAKTVLITSSVPGEGKTTTATNLAIALAQAGQTVCLVDADLRRPMVSEYLGLDRNAGLTTALLGTADINDLLQPWGADRLYVLTSGQVPPNPSELLGSEEMKQLIGQLEKTFDAVIVDAPPLLPVTDAAVLSQHVGGVVVVVGSQKLRQQDLTKSLEALEMVDASVLGVVLNKLPSKSQDAYSYSYQSFSEQPTARTTGRAKASDRTSRRNTQAEEAERHSFIEDSMLEQSQRPSALYPSSRIDRF